MPPSGLASGARCARWRVEGVGDGGGDSAVDINAIAVVERHRATGRVGAGLVAGFGLREGAFASTVAHDAHNIVVVGADTASMHTCVERMGPLGGGIVVAV